MGFLPRKFEVGDLIHYRKGNGLDPNRYMIVLQHTIKHIGVFTQPAYKLLEVRRGEVLEWDQDWVEGKMIPA